ncbi:hypothetical protein GCM10027406_36930 [Leifsonia lichenia]
MARWMTVAAGVAVACIVGATLTGFAPTEESGIEEVPTDLQGFVFVANETVYDPETLEEVATMDEYVEAYEDAGIEVDSSNAEATDTSKANLGFAPRLTTTQFVTASVRTPRVKMEAPGCSGQDQNRSLQRYSRGAKGGAARGVADLRCGNNSWGWRHVDYQHRTHWANKVAGSGASWNDFARWAMGSALNAPASAPYDSSRRTYAYTAPIQVWVNGKLKTQFNTVVPVTNGDGWRIITAYPAG